MQPVTRSSWLKTVMLFSLVLFVAQCGDDSDVVIEDELDCLVEGFEGGSYLFTATDVNDECLDGLLETFVPPGETFGPVDIPGVDDMPAEVDIPNVPLVGTVPVRISSDGQAIQVEGLAPIEVTIGSLGTVTATISGVLCPLSETGMDGRIRVTILSGPCFAGSQFRVTLDATGALQ